jgi:hypothetical protein
MATYNGAKYIREQLDSIAAQTFLPCELVVTDDGSSDDTLRLVDEFSKSAPFEVRIYRNESNLGFANNFLRAAGLCEGDLIAFCDQDDKWVESKLELCQREFADEEVSLCVHSSVVWNNEATSDRRWPDFKKRLVLYSNTSDPLTVYPGFSMVIRASIANTINHVGRPTDIHSLCHTQHPMSHDQWAWFISSIFGKIVCLPNSLAFHRQHGQNVCGTARERNAIDKLRMAMNTRSYKAISDLSTECAVFLENLIEQLPEELERAAKISEHKFRQRSQFLKIRSIIYDDNVNFASRLVAFCNIFLSRGYLADPSRIRLGPRAAMKDLLFGVPGLYRLKMDVQDER